MKNDIENVGLGFDRVMYLEARQKTIDVVKMVSSQAFLGMSEIDGHSLIDRALDIFGAEKKWHPSKFRIGKNTTKSFREVSEDVTLQDNDIFFIDIGPVFDGHEGDYGETFVFGENSEYLKMIEVCKKVFDDSSTACREKNLSGKELYRFAEESAYKYGYVLNLNMAGHRLGDFPHAIHFKGKLNEFDTSPKPDLWVLEILIKHSEKKIGAFHEDIIS